MCIVRSWLFISNNYKVSIFSLNLQICSVTGSVSLWKALYYFCKSPQLFCKRFSMCARNFVFFLQLYSFELFFIPNLVTSNSVYMKSWANWFENKVSSLHRIWRVPLLLLLLLRFNPPPLPECASRDQF